MQPDNSDVICSVLLTIKLTCPTHPFNWQGDDIYIYTVSLFRSVLLNKRPLPCVRTPRGNLSMPRIMARGSLNGFGLVLMSRVCIVELLGFKSKRHALIQ